MRFCGAWKRSLHSLNRIRCDRRGVGGYNDKYWSDPPSQKAAASGVASLNSSSLVVQNPASATATATASSIPISDSSGTLNSWVTKALYSERCYGNG